MTEISTAEGESLNTHLRQKPHLGFWQIWNMCFGFLGIQFGFALQNANASRIFQTLGADMETLPLLWVAAPLTGLIVQPIVGYMSDRTWNSLGRRRPYFLVGAVFTTLALLAMPNSPTLWIAAGTLWILDASINITMEPFRAFVGDMLPKRQRSSGYVMQSFFIALGAVVASALPWMMSNWLGVANTAPEGEIPDSVRYSFFIGAAVLFSAVMWTIARTREYSPEQLASFEDSVAETASSVQGGAPVFRLRSALLWLSVGALGLAAAVIFDADKSLYLLAAGILVFGALQYAAIGMQNRNQVDNVFFDMCRNLVEMPQTMKRLAWVQFFSWFALFTMWIYTTPAVTSFHYGTSDTASARYNEGADWVSVLFAGYNVAAVFAAMLIPLLIRRLGLFRSHQFNLLLGALGLASFAILRDPAWLLASEIGIGFAWASIVSIPYAILANSIPAARMGIFMGIFNFFIVIPQLLAAAVLGIIVEYVFGGEPIHALSLAAASMVAAAFAVSFVEQRNP